MRNRFYIPGSVSARDDMPLWDLESLDQVLSCKIVMMSSCQLPQCPQETIKSAVAGAVWTQHCELLAGDHNLGFRFVKSRRNSTSEFPFIFQEGVGVHCVAVSLSLLSQQPVSSR